MIIKDLQALSGNNPKGMQKKKKDELKSANTPYGDFSGGEDGIKTMNAN